MTGNCLGWCAYGYYKNDAFVLAANLPGLVLSIWLNSKFCALALALISEISDIVVGAFALFAVGAAKLHYSSLLSVGTNQPRHHVESTNESPEIVVSDDARDDTLDDPLIQDGDRELRVVGSQETAFFRIAIFWALTLVWCGFVHPENPTFVLGVVVNVNLIFFYGAPLQTMRTVISEKRSESIHLPTLTMHLFNTSFWMAYGVARRDPVILLPNVIGFFLGLIQAVLCLLYPRGAQDEFEPLHQQLPESATPIS